MTAKALRKRLNKENRKKPPHRDNALIAKLSKELRSIKAKNPRKYPRKLIFQTKPQPKGIFDLSSAKVTFKSSITYIYRGQVKNSKGGYTARGKCRPFRGGLCSRR